MNGSPKWANYTWPFVRIVFSYTQKVSLMAHLGGQIINIPLTLTIRYDGDKFVKKSKKRVK